MGVLVLDSIEDNIGLSTLQNKITSFIKIVVNFYVAKSVKISCE